MLVNTYAKLVSKLLGTRSNVESLINTKIEGFVPREKYSHKKTKTNLKQCNEMVKG